MMQFGWLLCLTFEDSKAILNKNETIYIFKKAECKKKLSLAGSNIQLHLLELRYPAKIPEIGNGGIYRALPKKWLGMR
jgi:hypothetical protein